MAYYPPVGFHFRVQFSISDEGLDTHFQEVSGLSVDYETETIKEGGENRFVHKLPVRTQYANLSFKRGLLLDSKVLKWCLDAFENRIFQPAGIQISLLNEQHQPLKTWSVTGAWPLRWSVSNFNAQENTVVIESLDLSYQYFKLI